MMYIGFAAVLLIFGLLNFFAGFQMFRSFSSVMHLNPRVFAVIWVILTIASFADMALDFPTEKSFPRQALHLVGGFWLGCFVYFLIAAAVSGIGMLVAHTPEAKHIIGALCYVTAFALIIIAAVNGSRVYEKHYELKTEKGDKLRIALLSDVHLGSIGYLSRLEQAAEIVNSADADIVCIAGDLYNSNFNSVYEKEAVKKLFSELNSTYGVYACPGNHDAGSTYSAMDAFTEECGIICLNDESLEIDNKILLIGRRDASPIGGYNGETREIPEFIAEGEKSKLLTVVMEHNPMHYDEYTDLVDLIISGHTHSGQLWPGNLITKAMYKCHYGYYTESEKPQLITCSGTGLWGPPMRLGTRCEVAIIDISE